MLVFCEQSRDITNNLLINHSSHTVERIKLHIDKQILCYNNIYCIIPQNTHLHQNLENNHNTQIHTPNSQAFFTLTKTI